MNNPEINNITEVQTEIKKQETKQYLAGYLGENNFDISPEKLQFIDIKNLPENYRKQFDRFDDKRLENVQIVLVPDFWKTSESHADKQVILFDEKYFNDKKDQDQIHWMTHELAHCQQYLDNPKDYQKLNKTPAFIDIPDQYPNNMIEAKAFETQFAQTKQDGITRELINNLLGKEYSKDDFVFLNKILDKIY